MSEKIPLLVLNSLSPAHQAQVAAVYDVTYLPVPAPAEREALIAAQGGRFRAVLTIGSIGLTAAEMAAMPKLELVCCMGAGYEGVALEAARARGIALANGAGTNDDCVADHAFGLLIGAMRHIRTLDRLCREGVRMWRMAPISRPKAWSATQSSLVPAPFASATPRARAASSATPS